MIVHCDECGRNYDDASRWTICPHGPLWAGPKSYCSYHDLVDCPLCKEGKTMRVAFSSDNLLGDLLMQTPAMRFYKLANPDHTCYYWVPENDTGVHVMGTEVLLHNNPYLEAVGRGAECPFEGAKVIPLSTPTAFNTGMERRRTIPEMLGEQIGIPIPNIKYDLHLTDEELAHGRTLMESLSPKGKPIVVIGRHSASCASNDPKCNFVANKCVANRIWVEVAEWLINKGYLPVAVGSKRDLEDNRYAPWPGVKCYGEAIRNVAGLMANSAGVLSVDTGIRHIAAAVGANMYCISGAIPTWLIKCVPVKEGQEIYEEHVALPLVSRKTIVEGAKRVLKIK